VNSESFLFAHSLPCSSIGGGKWLWRKSVLLQLLCCLLKSLLGKDMVLTCWESIPCKCTYSTVLPVVQCKFVAQSLAAGTSVQYVPLLLETPWSMLELAHTSNNVCIEGSTTRSVSFVNSYSTTVGSTASILLCMNINVLWWWHTCSYESIRLEGPAIRTAIVTKETCEPAGR
jgi:hypothetical protein